MATATAPTKPPTELMRGPEPLTPGGLPSAGPEIGQVAGVLRPGFRPAVGRLPVELEVAVPVRAFRVRHLLSLDKGQVIETRWAHGDDLPLTAGDVQLAWSEFEVIDTRLAVRLTRLG